MSSGNSKDELDRYLGTRIGVLLRVPHQAVVARIHHELHRIGYTDLQTAHMVVFQYIEHDPGSRITWLAEKAHITKQSMGYLVDYLENRGYLERLPDPVDARAKLVRMTNRGWAVHELAFEIVAALENEWAAALGPERLVDLRNLLGDLCQVLTAGAEPSSKDRG